MIGKLCNVLKIYCVGGQLLGGIKTIFIEASACVRVDGELNESFPTGVRQRFVISP